MANKKKEPLVQTAPEANALNPFQRERFRRKRKLTLEIISLSKLPTGSEFIFRCESELVLHTLPSKFSPDGKTDCWTIDVTAYDTQETHMMPCPAIVASALQRAGYSLVGRYFSIVPGDKPAGKRYRDYQVDELEAEE